MSTPHLPSTQPISDQPLYPGMAAPASPPFAPATEPPQPLEPDLDAELSKLTPHVWVTYLLVAINVVVFLVMAVRGVSPINPTPDQLIQWGGSIASKNYTGELWRLFTACFLHIGIVHLVGNIVGLLLVGPRTERIVGPWGFLFAYILGGLFGELVSSVWNQQMVCVGASGAIFGVMGVQLAILLTHPDGPVRQSLAKAWIGILVYFGFNLVAGFAQAGVDNAAHVGGLMGGFLCGLILSQAIEEASVGYRWLRNSALILCGTLAILGGYGVAHRLSAPGIEWVVAFEDFSKVEEKALSEFQAAVQKAKTYQIDEPELGAMIEKNVLPLWREGAAKLQKTNEPWLRLAKQRKLVLGYVQARMDSLEHIALACKETDPEAKQSKMNRAITSRKRYEDYLHELKSL